jgi:hypothetical protein
MTFDYDKYADEKIRLGVEQLQQVALEPAKAGLDLHALIAGEEQAEQGLIDPEPHEDWGRCPRCEHELAWVTSSKHCSNCGYHEGCCG